MTKLLGTLLCMSACLLLGLGVTGCTKKNKDTTTTKTTNKETKTTPEKGTTTKTKETTTTEEKTAKLTVKAPDESITQGGTATVKVSITREHLSAPVEIKLTELPDGVKVEGTPSIAKDATSADLTLKADAAAKEAKDHAVKVWASSGSTKADSSFKLTVKKK